MKNLKNINLNKRIVAIILLLIIMLTNISPVFAVSNSGTGQWVAGQWDSNVFTTDNNSSVGMLMRRLVNYTTGEKTTTFCSEHFINSPTGEIHTATHSVPTDPKVKQACKVAYFGWYSKYGDYIMDGGIMASSNLQKKLDYCFTQQLIWEVLGQSNATFKDSSIQRQYENFRNVVNNEIRIMQTRPSFDATTVEIDAGETKVLTDSNGVLSQYSSIDNSTDNVRFIHNKGENTLTIIAGENVEKEKINISDYTFQSWGMVKEESRNQDTTIYFTFKEGVQNQLMAMHYNDPVPMAMSLKVNLFGKLELQKLDTTGVLVDGAVYNVSGNNYNQDIEVRNGKIVIEKLRKGIYTVKEKNAPNGYLLDTKSYSVEIKSNETSIQAIINNEPTGSIKITKTDVITGNSNRIDGTSHHGDASLSGAIYTLYAKEDVYNKSGTIKFFSRDDEVATYTFNEYGQATINITNKNTNAVLKVEENYLAGLPLGKYFAKETTVPTGYKLDEKVYEFNLEYKNQNTAVIKQDGNVTEDVQRAKFEVIKISSNNNTTANIIENAEFTAILSKYVQFYGSFKEATKHINEYANDEYDIFRTGSDGHGISKLLAYGEYEVRETYTPSDKIETVEPFYVRIDRNSNGVIKELIENDLPFESYLKMIKEDKETGKRVTFSNATFKLYKLNEDTNVWEKVKCKTGIFSHDSWKTDKNGIAYTENKLKAGIYKIDEVKIPNGFLALDEEIRFEINRSNKTLEFDEDYDAYITITVKNQQPKGTIIIDKTVALKENVDTSLIDISDLSKIEFTLYAKENVIDMADGSVIYEKGREIKKYNLDRKGDLRIENLPLGTYELKETKTLEGLVENTSSIEIEFIQKDDTTKVYTETRIVENNPTEFEFSKKEVTGDDELEGAKLTVIDENGNVIDSWISTDKKHYIEGLKLNKEYTLKEEIAPDGYVKSTEIKFIVENTKDIQKVVMIDKVVELTKEDIGGKEVEGAKIQILDENNEIVDEWISTKEAHKIQNLEEGKTYTLHEEIAPEGFVKATDVQFEVTAEKKNQSIKLINKIVELTKEDVGGKEVEGAKIQIFDENGEIVDEWISTKEAHKIQNLEEGKTYTLHEEIAPNEYVKATDTTFTVTTDKETQNVTIIDKMVEVSKIDITNGEELEGAELEIIDKETGETIEKWISTKEPHKTTGLEENKTYILRETTAPYAYEIAEEIEFTVTEEKETQKIEMKDMPILKSVRVEKIDIDTKEHIKSNKFEFGIFEDAECKNLIKKSGANEDNGTALFEDLRYGIYYIKEIKAPLGYRLSDKVVKIEINDEGVFADGVKLEEKDNVYSFEYYNALLPVIQTGNETNYIILAVIGILSLIGIIIVGYKLIKKNN